MTVFVDWMLWEMPYEFFAINATVYGGFVVNKTYWS
jgi:hypothetical protein